MPRHIFKAVFLAAPILAATLAAAQPAKSDKPLATRDLDVDGVVAEVIESNRKDGTLSVRVRFRNTGDKPAKISLTRDGSYHYNYITAGKTKYPILRDTKGHVVATPADGGGGLVASIKPKGTWNWWAKFPAPPPEEKAYTLYLQVGPPIDDVPIIDK